MILRELALLGSEVEACRACPRLVEWREHVARERVARFRNEEYWGKPVPGFGDPEAEVAIVGLAPAANGANRTGRMFTGDRSGDFLYASLHRTGFASQAESSSRDDGLVLRDAWVTSVNRCAPPSNRPTPQERDACVPFLTRELELLRSLRVIVALGSFAWDGALRALAGMGEPIPRPRPRFGHGAKGESGRFRMIGCFHPSQQNTFTGKLTPDMLDEILEGARS